MPAELCPDRQAVGFRVWGLRVGVWSLGFGVLFSEKCFERTSLNLKTLQAQNPKPQGVHGPYESSGGVSGVPL